MYGNVLLEQTPFTVSWNPKSVTVASDGRVWFPTSRYAFGYPVPIFDSRVGSLDPLGGAITEKTVSNGLLTDIHEHGGQLWLGDGFNLPRAFSATGSLRHFAVGADPSTSQTIPTQQSLPTSFADGPDGDLWFALRGIYSSGETGPSGLARLSSGGSVTTFFGANSYFDTPGGITPGASELWFTKPHKNAIAKSQLDGSVEEFPLPTASSSPRGIVQAADGTFWFTESSAPRIGRITSQGAVREFPIPSGRVGTAIVRGTDGALWVRTADSVTEDNIDVYTTGRTGTLVRIEAGGPETDPEIREYSQIRPAPGFALAAGPEGTVWYGSESSCSDRIFGLDCGALVEVRAAPCPNGELCLDGRFRIRLEWRAPEDAASSPGVPVAQTATFGYFWFFSPNNVEVAVKIVDGREFNGHFWLFAASLTNVEFELTVTDTVTGTSKSYSNSSGQLASFADTEAF